MELMTIGWLRWLAIDLSLNGTLISSLISLFEHFKEGATERRLIHKNNVICVCRFANITDGSIIGCRAPYLRVGGNKQFEMMADQVG